MSIIHKVKSELKEQAIKFAEETGELLNRCKGLNTLGWVYSDLGWISEAKKLNEESYKAALEIGSGSEEAEANAIVNLAENAVAEGILSKQRSILRVSQKRPRQTLDICSLGIDGKLDSFVL